MTYNRTTELRRLLTERGIEYETNDHMGVYETSWNGFTVMQLTSSAKLIMTVTPEQAIAATLGKQGYYTDRDDEGTHIMCDRCGEYIGTAEEIAATLGGGRLTAEQVRDAWCGNLKRDCLYDPPTPDWQAIADELGSGTCEVECFDDGADEGIDGEWFSYAPPTWYLSCGHTAQGEKPNFCPNCGARIRKAVE